MKKVLFLIHDLGPGGAERVLVNLANHMDSARFDVTVMTLFDVGVNRQLLAPHVHYKSCFRKMIRGNSHLMKLLSPRRLHRWLIKEHYDMEIAYLEGPSARVVSGCLDSESRCLAWIHCMAQPKGNVTLGFRSKTEAIRSYGRFDRVVCVSATAAEAFHRVFPMLPTPDVVYNTNDTRLIREKATQPVDMPQAGFHLIAVGRLIPVKGFDRLLRIHQRLRLEGYPVHTLILGTGELEQSLKNQAAELGVADTVSFLGYQTNPYAYVAKSDLFVCSSLSEGFSTAATEALIVGTPVCTVEVSGMKEMLGENNDFGIVTENSEQALYAGLKQLLDDPALLQHYKKKAAERGNDFNTKNTVTAVERLLEEL